MTIEELIDGYNRLGELKEHAENLLRAAFNGSKDDFEATAQAVEDYEAEKERLSSATKARLALFAANLDRQRLHS